MGQFTLNKPRSSGFIERVNGPKPGYASITCSTISNIPYNLIFTRKFNDSSILITIISCDYFNLSLADEHVGDITIPTQVIEYNQNFLQADEPIRLKYSNQIKLFKIRRLLHLWGHVMIRFFNHPISDEPTF